MTDAVADVERAMIAIRRSQQRRALSRIAKARGRGAHDPVYELLDVVEELTERGEAGTVTALSAAMGVDQPRASRLVARAVEQGLLRREADQRDGRRAVLVPTEAGQAHLDEMHAFRRGVFAEVMADWADEDRETFGRLLTAFVRGYSALG
ncbi:MarR family winged helix-turn-helix transcriptional regulator [Amycolatopsis vancoresmycina]|uniref:MarR family winged helix-turn-helix transcriptional regulator n=1 Tax=Amycolatopsis vancoresmycina TaxID=208444 RepID=UPI000527390C|nr:MarR family transcriptional regulator [Amycolatopsis vancoresmycina]